MVIFNDEYRRKRSKNRETSGCAPFVLKTASIPADILVRLRSNLCFWGEPEAYSGKGRPKKHASKFKLNEPTTWSDAESVLELDNPKLQRVRVSLWKNLHFRKAAARPMLLLRVERLNAQGNKRRVKTFVLSLVRRRNATRRGSLATLLALLSLNSSYY